MSTPHSNHSGSNYPEDGVSHYPKKKASGHKSVADFHKDQMGHMMGLMKKHHKSQALKKRAHKKGTWGSLDAGSAVDKSKRRFGEKMIERNEG